MTRLCWLALFLLAALWPHPPARAAETPGAKTTFSEVSSAIMSPVCPGKLLHDCPSAEGAQLRELVRRKIFAGETKAQIVGYFVETYGRGVLPKPPAEGFYLTAWLLPFGGLLAGFGVVIVLVRAWTGRPEAQGARPPDAAPDGSAARRPRGAPVPEDAMDARLRREIRDFEG